MKTTLAGLAAAALLAAAGAALFVELGVYDIAASRPHTEPVYRLLETAMKHSVRRRAAALEPPPGYAAAPSVARGAACFRRHCVQCHGAPGVAPDAFSLGLQPLPGPLVDAARRWTAPELYWITRHGVKMSGMPAWGERIADADLWALAGFLERLPRLSAAEYAAQSVEVEPRRCAPALTDTAATPRDGVAVEALGRLALHQYACNGCHRIPGVVGPDTQVGPPLEAFARRTRIAGGRLPNTTEALVQWIRFPREVDPRTTMPELGVSEAHARQMAAYLQTLH